MNQPKATHLFLPVQNADHGQDEGADADERHGGEQHDVARRQVQLGAPAAGGRGVTGARFEPSPKAKRLITE